MDRSRSFLSPSFEHFLDILYDNGRLGERMKKMEKRQLGNTDLYISKIGLGCMSLGTEVEKAKSIIDASLDWGINYFDTADLYDFGMNEEIVGKALKHVRDQVIIATKVGNRWTDKKDGWFWDASKTYIKEAVKQSLKRLQTDYIDLYQLHGGTMEDNIDETIEAFEELKQEGIIRYYGISSIRPTVIREYATKSNAVSVMMQYSMLDRRPEQEAFPIMKENGLFCFARGSLAKGLLTNKLLEKASPTIQEKGYLDYSYNELKEILPALKETLASKRSFTSVAIQFVLSNPTVIAAITGASSIEQLEENVKSLHETPLTEEELSFIRKLTKENNYDVHTLKNSNK